MVADVPQSKQSECHREAIFNELVSEVTQYHFLQILLGASHYVCEKKRGLRFHLLKRGILKNLQTYFKTTTSIYYKISWRLYTSLILSLATYRSLVVIPNSTVTVQREGMFMLMGICLRELANNAINRGFNYKCCFYPQWLTYIPW